MFPDPLRVFYEAVRQGSIRRAAEALSLAPSSISRQIAILERQVGTRLLDRAATGVSLTHAGRLVAEFSASVLVDYDSLRTDLDDLKGQKRGLIRIGALESVVATLAVQAVEAFRAKNEDVEFHIRVLPAPALLEAVRHGEVDIGAAFCPDPDSAFVGVARIPDPIVAAIPPGHPLADRSAVTIEELATARLAVPDKNFGVRRILDRAFHASGAPLRPALSSNTFAPLREAVRIAGLVATLPRISLLQADESPVRIATIANDEANATFVEFLVLRGRRQSMILRNFIAELKGVVENHQSASGVPLCATGCAKLTPRTGSNSR